MSAPLHCGCSQAAGGAAAAGRCLEDVAAVAHAAAAGLRSMGAALTTCSLPGATEPPSGPGEGEMELGLGIHGEPGAQRCAAMSSLATVEHLLGQVMLAFGAEDGGAGGLQAGERVALMVNNLGGLTTLELFVVARDAMAYLAGAAPRTQLTAIEAVCMCRCSMQCRCLIETVDHGNTGARASCWSTAMPCSHDVSTRCHRRTVNDRSHTVLSPRDCVCFCILSKR